MRGRLLAGTALVAAGSIAGPALAADPVKLELRGYLQSMVSIGRTDRDVVGTTGTSYRPENFRYEGEIWFTGQTKLDNGTTVGVRIELEAWSQNTGVSAGNPTGTQDQLDEEYLFAFGDWGRIEFGSTDGPSFKMPHASPSALIGWGFHEHNFNHFGTGFTAANQAGRGANILGFGAAHNVGFGDSTKLVYYTPRFAGFQIGVAYAPAFSLTASTAQCASRSGTGPISNCPRNSNAYHNAVDLAANYLGKFGEVSVAAWGGYFTGGFDRGVAGGANNNNATSSLNGRWRSWAAGGRLGFAGFTLGGGVGRDNNGLRDGAFGSTATRWYTASLMYERDRWQISAGWWGGRNADGNASAALGAQNAPGKDKLDYFEIGANYTLSPGVRLTGGWLLYDGSGQSKSEKADSWAFIFGTVLVF